MYTVYTYMYVFCLSSMLNVPHALSPPTCVNRCALKIGFKGLEEGMAGGGMAGGGYG